MADRTTGNDPRVVIIVDQGWMHDHLGERRIDVTDLREAARAGRVVVDAFIVMPDLPILRGTFDRAAKWRRWSARYFSGTSRQATAEAIVEIATTVPPGVVTVVVTGDGTVVDALRARGIDCEIVDDLAGLPDLQT